MSKKQAVRDYFAKPQPHLSPQVNNYTVKLAQKVVEKLRLSSKHKILEIGAGAGRFTIPLLKHSLKITALDMSEEILRQLREKLEGRVTILKGEIEEIDSLTKDKFDAAVGFFILHHLDDLTASLRSLKKVLKKEARVGFVEPNPLNPLFYIQPFVYKNMNWEQEKGFRKMTHQNLEKAFREAGFNDFTVEKFGLFPPFLLKADLVLGVENWIEKVFFFKPFLPLQLITANTQVSI